MKIKIHDHQRKSNRLAEALKSQGAELVSEYAHALLIDFDGPVNPYPAVIQHAYEQGAEIVLYSHGAPVIVAWDGIWKPGPLTRLYLAQSPGQKWVMNAYKYPVKVEVIGWHFCEQKRFEPVEKVENILFAPWHPHGHGWMNPETMALNSDVFAKLLKLTDKYKLTVRHVLNPKYSGIEWVPDVIYQQSDMTLEQSVRAIDEAELIVTNPGTFASLAVARGKPVVMYGQDVCPHDGFSPETLKYVKHWDDYRDFMHYPYDIDYLDYGAMEYIFNHAARVEAVDWREKFINHSIDPVELVNILKRELRL